MPILNGKKIIINRRYKTMYNKLRDIQKLIFKGDDRMDQDDLFELQEKIAELTLEVAQKEEKTEQLIKDFKWLYDTE